MSTLSVAMVVAAVVAAMVMMMICVHHGTMEQFIDIFLHFQVFLFYIQIVRVCVRVSVCVGVG